MNLRDQLQAALGSAYTLDRELTGGGMSRVFVATETAFGRKVVVKVLHPELAAEVTQERFAREIQVVANLQQANIVPLLTTGHTGEVPFYTMPFVEGHSLRQRLADQSQLAVPEVIGVLRDVARALAYAHDAGVVHRDIKPENILLSGGAAVVTDFGIAKAISVARTQPGAATITQAGSGIGTPAYMAPEQAAGDPAIDHRADIYAFGCLAYELLSGRPPFDATSVHELIAAHISRTPVDLKDRRTDTPSGLAQLVMRCLAKQPSERPQSARELLDSLDALITPVRASASASRVGGPNRVVTIATATALAAAVIVAGWLISTRDRRPAAEPTLAVIPFVNVGGDSAQDYLADGVSDELATALGKLRGVHLAARSAAYRYRGQRGVDVREIGQALQVRYVVQGTLRRVDDQLRVSAQLTDAESGRELWSDNFDRTTREVFRTQDDITAAIVRALAPSGSVATTSPAAGSKAGSGTADVEAYNLYLRAEFALRARRVREAAEMFRQAIARDANFARAFAGLSQTYALGPYFSGIPTDSANTLAEGAAARALALDSTLAEAHMSRGMALTSAWKWDEARVALTRAVAADPGDVQAHFQLGRFYYYMGEDESALAEWNRAKQIDPFSALASGWTAQLLLQRGQRAEALSEIARALEYDSVAVVIKQLAVRVYADAGERDKARAIAARMPPVAPWTGMTAYSLGRIGDRAAAEAIIRRLESARPMAWFSNAAIAWGAAALGDTAKLLASLERATDAHEIWPSYNGVRDPMFDAVRKSPRWAALLKRVGLEKIPGALGR
jgi:TolB-like protein/tRNA A-37 threonylcarbamoyl transferase component Bud32